MYTTGSSLINYGSLLGGQEYYVPDVGQHGSQFNTAGTDWGGYASGITAGLGAIQQGLAAYYSASAMKRQLKFQAEMEAINARMAERTAQSILRAGSEAQGQVSLHAGKVKSSQRASQAARGVVLGEGSAAEEVATTDLMKDIDRNIININSVQQASAARMQSTNHTNMGLFANAEAKSINPLGAGFTSLMGAAAPVAAAWYRWNKGGGMN